MFDHPYDVLFSLYRNLEQNDPSALVVVTETIGGSIRAPGAIMAVSPSGEAVGYVSNGCIDANLIFQAQEALKAGKSTRVTYGAGSPFKDIKLPCGGSITLAIIPVRDKKRLKKLLAELDARKPCCLEVGLDGDIKTSDREPVNSRWLAADTFAIRYMPKLALHIAGVGAEMVALARLSQAAGFHVEAYSSDGSTLDRVAQIGEVPAHRLTTPDKPPPMALDPYAAFILMFHDHNWEISLLDAAIRQGPFYIGALGSRKTHASRCSQLLDLGHGQDALDRIHGPIGLIPSLRDASMVAVSALAEIVEHYRSKVEPQ